MLCHWQKRMLLGAIRCGTAAADDGSGHRREGEPPQRAPWFVAVLMN